MNGPALAAIAGIAAALVLVLGALRGRRLGARRTMWLGAVWLAIILLVWAAVTIGSSLAQHELQFT